MTTSATTIDLSGLPEPVVRDLQRLVETLRGNPPTIAKVARPPLRGRFAEPGLGISEEDIDEAQREMWSGFPRDFPETIQE